MSISKKILVLFGSFFVVIAQANTLDKIKSSSSVTMGVRESWQIFKNS